jgi:hypothetical protein
MGIMAPTQPAVGDQATAAWADEVAQDVISLAGGASPPPLLFTPGGNTDTPGAGTATWVTLGNITVPTWATKCNVTYTMNGIFDTGTTSNVSAVLKIGSVAGGVSKRIDAPGVANQRFHVPITDRLTGLSTGSQSVTISATFTAGSVIRADVTSFFTALFTFQP